MDNSNNQYNRNESEKQGKLHHIGILEKLKEKIVKESWTKYK